MFGVPESWAGITSPPWPALSDTIGHLEQLWHPVRVIVVTLIVFAAFHAVTYPPGRAGEPAVPESKPARGRTPCGRFARAGTGAASAVPVMVYFPAAIGVVAGGSILAAAAGGGMFVLGYVIYGLTAIFLVLIPNALAARRAAIPTALQPAPPPSTPAQPVFARAGEPAAAGARRVEFAVERLHQPGQATERDAPRWNLGCPHFPEDFPRMAPSGDAQPAGPSVACPVNSTCTNRGDSKWRFTMGTWTVRIWTRCWRVSLSTGRQRRLPRSTTTTSGL